MHTKEARNLNQAEIWGLAICQVFVDNLKGNKKTYHPFAKMSDVIAEYHAIESR